VREFYVVWVAGNQLTPTAFNGLEAALEEAQRLRRELTQREVYVLAPTHRIDGAGLAKIVDGAPVNQQPIALVVRRKKNRVVLTTPE
jgi:hypothetical protein